MIFQAMASQCSHISTTAESQSQDSTLSHLTGARGGGEFHFNARLPMRISTFLFYDLSRGLIIAKL